MNRRSFQPTNPDPFINESPAWTLLEAPRRRTVEASSLAQSIGFAIEGVGFAFRTQRNFRIHCAIGAFAVAFACLLRLPVYQVALVAVLALLVLCAELINTAIEATCDLKTSGVFDPAVKHIKDIAAAAVLVVSVGATTLGTAIFLPAIIRALAR